MSLGREENRKRWAECLGAKWKEADTALLASQGGVGGLGSASDTWRREQPIIMAGTVCPCQGALDKASALQVGDLTAAFRGAL